MHMSFVRLASVTAIGVLSALAVPAATPASAQCEPSECAGKASKHKPGPMGMATSAGEFSTATQAKAHCPSDTVVWVNTKSHIYHFAGTRGYGSTKQGAYMCQAEAKSAGDRAGPNAKARPSL
ncbi:hypothetical protein SAMN05444161_2682 [Rhizobiales bacterium GAS191]|jgi:hypothetical protein|nr:hypothetical protein SAMN05519103_01848 [Rhizobiales bacterium GAS113]SEC04906.1 hypothetical protein SAMN05519104_0640 [Rhizobiales bacterium GAS188]SED17557.1 hypothetical protein SAMN05444161_2682 [Rhizobiales bacterium GAS191]